MSRIVTLTTDFGSGSGYAAELKGRLLHAGSAATLVDISHDVPPHDVRAAAWLARQACPSFPAGTLHLIVVDPGVGTPRHLVWARLGGPCAQQEFLCPDNGVLSLILERMPLIEARRLPVSAGASATFHGRDVLAPAALRLLAGESPQSLGERLETLAMLVWPTPRRSSSRVEGEVVHVDAFGNLITNLPADVLPQIDVAGGLRVGGHTIRCVVGTYGDAPAGTAVVLAGSQGLVEAAVVEGRADERLGCGIGTPVSFTPAEPGPSVSTPS